MIRFGTIFRSKIGVPSKKELFDNRINVYKKIIRVKNDMESHAYEDFKNFNNSDWFLLKATEKRINRSFINGEISENDYLKYINACHEAMRQFLSDYIDRQDENSVYCILRNDLKYIKKENAHLLNIDKMSFDSWIQIVTSAELARLTMLKIINGVEYSKAVKSEKDIISYQVSKYLRK